MKFFISDLLVQDKKGNNLLLENLSVPFKKKKTAGNNLLYRDCFLFSENVDSIENNELIHINTHSGVLKGDVYFLYSDGGSYNNGGKDSDKPTFGSVSTIIMKNNKEQIYEYSEARKDVTNNQCELNASLVGLDYLKENVVKKSKEPINVILISDSQYLIKGINEWMDGWIRRGWKNNEGQTTRNLEIWKKIKSYLDDENFNIFTCWVRGHQDSENSFSEFNNKCDLSCNLALNQILEENGLPLRKLK